MKYAFDLAVRNVRGQMASNFFERGLYDSATILLKLIEVANISYLIIMVF